MSAFVAFLHHLAAFALVAAIAIEFVLIRDPLTLSSARKLQVADAVYGISAGLVLIVGLSRVFLFEKGAAYYFHSAPFLGKLALFIAIAALSIYPTVVFLSWRQDTKQGRIPAVTDDRRRRLRRIIHCELAAVVLLILCAAMMARGIGFYG
jgi:putative membrane protein